MNGIAGQFIKIEGVITNLSHNETINGGIAYISIVHIKNKIPIEAGQGLPLEWNVRLVKAGSYTIDLLLNKDGDFAFPPSESSKVFLEVAPKLNLNPGNVLPVAFGVPALIVGVLGVEERRGFMVDYDIKRRLPAPSISLNHRLPDLNKEVFRLYWNHHSIPSFSR